LIEELELTPVRGKHQLALEFQSRFELVPHAALKENVLAAPRRLCPAQRQMGVAEEFVRVSQSLG